MKKILPIIGLALASVINNSNAQRIESVVRTNVVVVYAPLVWTGSNAQNIASQLYSITNLDGSDVVVPDGSVHPRLNISIIVLSDTNGVNTVRADIR